MKKRVVRKNKRRGSQLRSGTQKKFFYKDDIFISRMSSILKLPHSKTKELFYQRIITAIRLNNLSGEPAKILKILKDSKLDLKEVPWSKYTYIVKNRDKGEVAKMPEYSKGLVYIQNLSSMIPPILLNPQKNDIILDVCSAPGSKTTQLASLMENEGEIIANDDSYERVKKLRSVLGLFNVKNTKSNCSKGEILYKSFENYFDKVLLDAPCSGEGMIYLAKPRPLKFWSVRKSQEMSKIQKNLIESAYKCLKPGGTLVYSTCSLSPNENESVVSSLLEKEKGAKLLDIDLITKPEFQEYKTFTSKGLKNWNGEIFHPDIQKTIRIIPGKTMIGFYVALISKKALN